MSQKMFMPPLELKLVLKERIGEALKKVYDA
jgi:hypothetical protein